MNVGGHSIARRRVYSIVAALAAFLSSPGSASAQRVTEHNPLWQIDARTFGLPESRRSVEWPEISLSQGTFGFQNNNILLISWITPDEPLPQLPKQKKFSRLPVVPAQMHLLILGAKTGTKLKEQELSVPSAPTDLLINHTGNLVIRTGDSVKLYSSDLVQLKQAEFPFPVNFTSINSASNIEISPDGRRITLCSEQGTSTKVEVLNAENLQPLSSPFAARHCVLPLPQTQLRNGETLAVFDGNRMVIRAADGNILFTDILPKRYLFGPMKTARDSGVFAVEIRRLRGATIPTLDMYAFPAADQIAVYSLDEKKRILTIKVKGSSPWPPWTFVVTRYALSPDGSLLAVLSNDLVKVYGLPQKPQ